MHIIEIIQQPSKYYVYMSNNNISGFWTIPFGTLGSTNNMIEICEKKINKIMIQ